MTQKYFLKKVSDYAIVGGLGASLVFGLTACEDKNANGSNSSSGGVTEAAQKKGAFVIIEKTPIGSYKIVDEFPSSNTTIVLREKGKERILSKEEVDTLVKEEAIKVDNGTSNLTNPNGMGNLSLGEALLASAAGAIIGSFIGNKLFGNQNYQANRQSSYKNPSTYSRSVDSFKKARTTTSSTSKSTKRTGFFGSSRTSSSRSFFGG